MKQNRQNQQDHSLRLSAPQLTLFSLERGSALTMNLLTTLLLSTFLWPLTSYAQELFDVPAPSASPTAPRGPLKLPLLTEYRGEEARGVKYFNERERALHRVVAREGRLVYVHNGRPLNEEHTLPTPRPQRTPHPAPLPKEARAQGYAIYVLSPQGELYVSFEAETHRVHHSSLLSGGPVQCAGELLVFNGELVALNNKSGHYRPPPKALKPLLDLLKSGGVRLEGVHVERVGLDL